jgi:hypothetical protein
LSTHPYNERDVCQSTYVGNKPGLLKTDNSTPRKYLGRNLTVGGVMPKVKQEGYQRADISPFIDDAVMDRLEKEDPDLYYGIQVLQRALEVACIPEIEVHSEDEPTIEPIKQRGASMTPDDYLHIADQQFEYCVEYE